MAALEGASPDCSQQKEENVDERKTLMTDKLNRRDDERLADVQKRKEQRENAAAKNESADFFQENFNRARNELEAGLIQSDGMETSKLSAHFDSLVISLQKMQKFVGDSSMFLAAYEVQKAHEALSKLQSAIQDRREVMIPKKKFAFKAKKKAVVDKPVTVVADERIQHKPSINVQITDCSFSDMSNQTLTKHSTDTNQKDVALARLTNCTVKLYGSPSAVHVNNMKNCKIFSGPVSGSVFIDDCKDCVFILACQQLRVHTTTDTNCYLHVTSRAIIEDSTRLQFAPYNWTYDGLDDHYEYSGLDRSRNSWDDVDDFNWLASDVHSPNWSVLEEHARHKTWED